jgi:hypothetical protein
VANYSVELAEDGFYYVVDSKFVRFHNTKSVTVSDARDKAEVQNLRLSLSSFAGRLRSVERLDANLYHLNNELFDVMKQSLELYMSSQFVGPADQEAVLKQLQRLLAGVQD